MVHGTEGASSEQHPPFDLDVFILSLEGEFDIAERVRLLDAFGVSTSAPVVVIDLHKTRYVDSSVLECIVALERATAKRGAKLTLTGLRPEIRRIFEVCGLDRFLDIRDEMSDVTSALGADPARVRRLTLISEPPAG